MSDDSATTQIHPEFKPYVAQFNDFTDAPLPNLIIDFGNDTKAGKCVTAEEQKIIVINRTVWDSSCDAGKRALLFHELGHCVLNRGHVDKLSYMAPDYITYCPYYETNEEALLDEMFGG